MDVVGEENPIQDKRPVCLLALKAGLCRPHIGLSRWISTRGESVRERKPAHNPNKQTNKLGPSLSYDPEACQMGICGATH